MARLLYVGQKVADDLKNNVGANLDRYRDGDFADMEALGDWRIPLSVDADVEQLKELSLERGGDEEAENSLLVGRVLRALTPTLARENRVWVRLSHIECLEYSRSRWLPENANDERVAPLIGKHFFAPTLTACRDDHAVSRLWWNYRIAAQIMPDAPERALRRIVSLADIRQGLVERPGIGARPALARGVVRALERDNSLNEGPRFRGFMRTVNLLGAGVAFEVLNDTSIDDFMRRCADQTV